jgi:APA family basic amino acid/polyamine antiporter
MMVYVMGSLAVMGMIPAEILQKSNAPFADAATIIWGEQDIIFGINASKFVAIGAIVSTFGALNGWILLQGQIPMAASRDGIFPVIFKKENKKGLPVMSLVISSVLISGLMMMNFTRGLTDTFTFMILMTTICVLVAYSFSAAAYAYLLLQDKNWRKTQLAKVLLALLAFIYALWAVIGSSQNIVYWGFIAVLSGIPFYIWMKRAA